MWGLRMKGLTQAEIGRKMEITRQAVNKTLNAIDSKVSRAMLEAAQLNRVEVRRLDSVSGFLSGRSSVFGMDVLITFSQNNGIQLWYKGEGGCSECERSESCRQKLIAEANERGITLPANVETVEPSKIADILFEKMLGEFQ